MVENIDRVVGRGMVLLGTYSQYMPNNWKLYMENVRDSITPASFTCSRLRSELNRLSMKGGIKLSDNGWHHISYSIAETDRRKTSTTRRSCAR